MTYTSLSSHCFLLLLLKSFRSALACTIAWLFEASCEVICPFGCNFRGRQPSGLLSKANAISCLIKPCIHPSGSLFHNNNLINVAAWFVICSGWQKCEALKNWGKGREGVAPAPLLIISTKPTVVEIYVKPCLGHIIIPMRAPILHVF